MRQLLASVWPLFVGLALCSASLGLEGSLLPLRAFDEHFDTSDTGIVMSGYFIGFLVGALIVPELIRRVGHAKVFAAFASIAAASAILHASFVNIPSWLVLRIVTGVCIAALYIVTETWLNDRSSNDTRGKILNLYVMVNGFSAGIGSLFVSISNPLSYDPFVLASVLFSIGLVPLLLSSRPAPTYQAARRIGFRRLARKAPLGVGAITISSIAFGALVGAGPIYADKAQLTLTEVGTFMAIVYMASLVFMVPLGHMVDRFDRGRFIGTMSLINAVLAVLLALTPPDYEIVLYILIAPFSGICFAHYGFSLAATNDVLKTEEMVGAGATLFVCASTGMALGPILSTEVIEEWGPASFFLFLALVYALLVLYVWSLSSRQREATTLRRRAPVPVAPGLQSPRATSILLEDEILTRER
ncbi:MAG: MFS transporter [Pseudomonadota bacterium]